jgi:hypothetical protein
MYHAAEAGYLWEGSPDPKNSDHLGLEDVIVWDNPSLGMDCGGSELLSAQEAFKLSKHADLKRAINLVEQARVHSLATVVCEALHPNSVIELAKVGAHLKALHTRARDGLTRYSLSSIPDGACLVSGRYSFEHSPSQPRMQTIILFTDTASQASFRLRCSGTPLRFESVTGARTTSQAAVDIQQFVEVGEMTDLIQIAAFKCGSDTVLAHFFVSKNMAESPPHRAFIQLMEERMGYKFAFSTRV